MATSALHRLRRGVGASDKEWPSGVPRPGRLGSATSEVIAMAIALLVLAFVAIAFWIEAFRQPL